MKPLTLAYRQLSLAVKYDSVLFPFDTVQFLKSLSKEGFILPESVDQPVPLGAKFEVSGIVARKAETAIRLDTQRYILGVHSSDTKTVLAQLDSLEALLKTEFSLDNACLAQYYEFLSTLTVKVQKNPLESWHAHFAPLPIIDRFSQVLGMNVSPFGIRLAPKGEVPNQANWFDIRIEPSVQLATNYLNIEVVFRNTSREEVFTFVGKFEDTVRDLVSLVGQG